MNNIEKNCNVISLKITKNQINRAKELYSFKELNGSITKGISNIYGAIGEIIIHDYYNAKFESTYDYDLIIGDYKIDVKTKRTTVVPKDHYLCSITAFNIKQKCDYYFFVRVNENMEDCYLLGYKAKEDFFLEAKFAKKGDLDVNGWRFKDDCYNLEIGRLSKFKVDKLVTV